MPRRKSDKLWRDALMLAVKRQVEKGEPTKRLEALANKLVELALSGNVEAIKEVGNRLDGRAPQAITGADDGPQRLVVEIRDPTRRM